MNTSTALKSSDPIAKLARSVFPEYKGRKIKAATRSSYTMADYWDEGSRTYVRAIELSTGRVTDPAKFSHNPMNRGAHVTFEIPAGVAMIEHSIFCGKDCGLTVVTGPAPALAGSAEMKAIA